jgi:hypothetical protein
VDGREVDADPVGTRHPVAVRRASSRAATGPSAGGGRAQGPTRGRPAPVPCRAPALVGGPTFVDHRSTAVDAERTEPGAAFLLVDVIAPVGILTMRPRRPAGEKPPQSEGFFSEALEELAGRPVGTCGRAVWHADDAEPAGLMESEFAEATQRGAIRERRAGQLADAAEALAEGAAAAAEGKEEPPDLGRSPAQLFGT